MISQSRAFLDHSSIETNFLTKRPPFLTKNSDFTMPREKRKLVDEPLRVGDRWKVCLADGAHELYESEVDALRAQPHGSRGHAQSASASDEALVGFGARDRSSVSGRSFWERLGASFFASNRVLPPSCRASNRHVRGSLLVLLACRKVSIEFDTKHYHTVLRAEAAHMARFLENHA